MRRSIAFVLSASSAPNEREAMLGGDTTGDVCPARQRKPLSEKARYGAQDGLKRAQLSASGKEAGVLLLRQFGSFASALR